MTDHSRLEAAWRAFEAGHPALPPRTSWLRALCKEAFSAGWLACELALRKEPG